jgi:hypothetical protein
MQVATTVSLQRQYTFQLYATPILQGSLTIGCSNPGNLTNIPTDQFRDAAVSDIFINPGQIYVNDQLNGRPNTIDYLSGQVTINFSTLPIVSGVPINAHFYAYVAARPRDIMFFNQQFTVRPVPNDAYRVRMVAQYQPTVGLANLTPDEAVQFSNQPVNNSGFTVPDASQAPLYYEWWQLIVYGTSIKIYIRQGDHEEAAKYAPYYEKMKLEAQRRTLKQMSNDRIRTIYSDGQGSTVPFPPYPIY